MALNVSWTPPPVSQLVVNNNDCTYASQFVAAELQTENESAPIDAIVNFLGSLVPDTWTDEPTDAGLVLWYYSWDESTAEDILEMAKESVLESCGTAICPFLQIEGDPDLAGLGVGVPFENMLGAALSNNCVRTDDGHILPSRPPSHHLSHSDLPFLPQSPPSPPPLAHHRLLVLRNPALPPRRLSPLFHLPPHSSHLPLRVR